MVDDLLAEKEALLSEKNTSLATIEKSLGEKRASLATAEKSLTEKKSSLAATEKSLADREASLTAQQAVLDNRAKSGEAKLRSQGSRLTELRADESRTRDSLQSLQQELAHYQPSSEGAEVAPYDELLAFKVKHSGDGGVNMTPAQLAELTARLEKRDELLEVNQRCTASSTAC